jgi:predicted nucleic acid-binding protein
VSGTSIDTSVVVAALQSWHRDHARCLMALDAALAASAALLPVAVLFESYSVLTRLPAPHRLPPDVARRLLDETFREAVQLTPAPRDAWRFLAELAADGVTGGALYDAAILRSAAEAGAERILTLNLRDFGRLAPAEIDVVEPPPV